MIEINYTIINFDINKKIYDKLIAKQGDIKSRYLLFNLNINGAAIDLTNKNVRVYAIKPDGYEIFNDLVVSDPVRGTCILELTTQILAVCGIVKMELVITEGQKKLSSFEFELEVIKSLNRETSIVSTNEFTALIEGLAALSEYDKYKNEIKDARGSFLSLPLRLSDSDTKKANVIDVYTKVKTDELLRLKSNNIDSNRTTTAKDVTGAINELDAKSEIERGTNTNGMYVRFADGTQICSNTVDITVAIDQAKGAMYSSLYGNPLGDFPKPFAGTSEDVFITGDVTSGGGAWAFNSQLYNTTTTSAGSVFLFRPVTSVSQTYKFTYHAIGRWK